MKSILEGPKKAKVEEPEYPVLKIAPNSGRVVLFTARGTGVVVHEVPANVGMYPPHGVGHGSSDWAEHVFEPLKGKIILSN